MTKEPGALAMIAALFGLFLGGGAIGLVLASTFAPGSMVANAVSFFALPLAFAVGLQMWYGLALLHAVVRLLGMRRTPHVPRENRTRASGLAGSFVFLPLSSAAGATAGAVVGLLPTARSGLLAWLVYWAVGTIHGMLAWRLARAGVLMPPEST